MAEEAAPVETAAVKHKGTVKWFNPSKGFGFITPDDGGSDLFVHQTSILAEGFRSLREGEPVEYQTEPTEDGRTKAIQVSGPDGAAPQGAPKRPFVPQPVIPVVYEPQQGVYIAMPGPGRGPAQMGQMGQLAYVGGPGMGAGRGRGRGRGPPRLEGKAPPGTPGVSSGLQVVVHNLPWACTWQMLKDHFGNQQGLERADVIIDPDGRSRGFGTVRFATPDDALAAIQAVNNTELAGRVISVRIDRYA